MLCFRNLASLATLSSTGATAIDTTEAATLKRAQKDGYCVIPASGGKTLRAVFGSSKPVSVMALLGVTSAADIPNYGPNFINVTQGLSTQLDQSLRLAAKQTENYVCVFSSNETGTTFEIEFSATSQAVQVRQLWIGDGVRVKGFIGMPRGVLGGSEIVQPPSGAVFPSARPSWRKYSVTLPAVTDAQWNDEGGLIELESLGNGAEVLFMPAGVSSDAPRVGLLAIHGFITGFNSQQLRRGLRAVTFDITESR